MPSSEKKSGAHEKNTERAAEHLSRTNEYSLFFASDRIEKEFTKSFDRMPAHDVEAIKAGIKTLKKDPRQAAKKLHSIEIPNSLSIAQYRLRVGNYRVLYDIDEDRKRVVLLKLARRNERTYK